MRRLLATALAAACTLTASASAALAGADAAPDPTRAPATARWQGTFDVVGRYTQDDLNEENVGTSFTRVHRVGSSCPGTAACRTIRVTRSLSDGSRKRYTLTRTRPGTYTGTIGYDGAWWCERGDERLYTWTGRMKDTLTLTATRSNAAGVRAYEGTFRLSYPPYRIRAGVPRACRQYFASKGFEEGYRPVVRTTLAATRRAS